MKERNFIIEITKFDAGYILNRLSRPSSAVRPKMVLAGPLFSADVVVVVL